ncbi:MAG TPA: SNF2 helicase-associated domain-containing protein, partial [Streptomyces sp.]|nr:SNF2 helicase-associated domain-containing protein [Streptomyces sp.]
MAVPPGDGLARCAVVFLPGEPSRQGKVAFWRPDGGPLPEPGPGGGTGDGPHQLTVARPHGKGARACVTPALLLSVSDALPPLLRARYDPAAHPAAACWGAAAMHALHLLARGRLLPGIGSGDIDAWRAGPLDAQDGEQLWAIAAAMPAEAHAVPLPGSRPLRLPAPESLVRSFVDAVADTLPRTPAASHAVGEAFAAQAPQRLPGAREWAAEVAAGMDVGVRISLRLDLAAYDVFDGGAVDAADGGRTGRGAAAVVQVHSLADPTLVADAAQLWRGADHFGPRARIDTLLALRRAARVWAPLGRLLERPEPDVLPLTEEEVSDLLGRAAARLTAAGVAVHWPREVARELTATAVIRPAPGSASDGFGFFETD